MQSHNIYERVTLFKDGLQFGGNLRRAGVHAVTLCHTPSSRHSRRSCAACRCLCTSGSRTAAWSHGFWTAGREGEPVIGDGGAVCPLWRGGVLAPVENRALRGVVFHWRGGSSHAYCDRPGFSGGGRWDVSCEAGVALAARNGADANVQEKLLVEGSAAILTTANFACRSASFRRRSLDPRWPRAPISPTPAKYFKRWLWLRRSTRKPAR